MNKILFSLAALSSFALANANDAIDTNPRNTLITAIARNDYGTTLKALDALPSMTQADKDEFLEMADQMIINAIAWYNKHHNHPELGKDIIKAVAFSMATFVSATTTALTCGIVASTIEAHYEREHRNRLALLPPLEVSATVATVLAGLTTYFGYKTIQKIIAAWMKPSVRLENALRIKDAIVHHEIDHLPTLYSKIVVESHA